MIAMPTKLEALVELLLAACGVSFVHAVDPLVDVGNTRYLGTALPNGITQWLGMRYAAPPLGDLRFRAPIDPPANDTVQVADQYGPLCLSTGASFPESGHSEDCLFLDVFAPSSASSSSDSKLPVFFWIPGGGLNSLSTAHPNASQLIQVAEMDMVVVTHSYRVGPYGFLASEEIQNDGNINVGILDQRKALEWVQRHISKFGGDPQHVVLGGASAGAQSVTLHLTAFGGEPTDLFHAVIAESQSFPPIFSVSEAQFQYDALVERVGCAESDSSDSLACLRALDISALQSNNIPLPFPGRNNTPNFFYNAIVDGDLIPDIPYRLFEEGKFVKVPAVFGDDTNEGTIFTPSNLNSETDMDNFLLDNFPKLNESSLETIHRFYPESEQFPGRGTFFFNAALAYGELRYNCPGIFISNEIRRFQDPTPNWLYHYNVEDPDQVASGLGVPHTVEVHAIWGLNTNIGAAPASYSTTNAAIIPVIRGYWTSFIRSFDPNTHRASGTAEWVQFDGTQRILFETDATRIETIPSEQQERCDFLISIGKELDQ